MKISKVDLFEVIIPFRFSFKHASNSRSICHSLLIRVTTDSGIEGWGEAHPRKYLTGETIATCRDYARNNFSSLFNGVSFSKNIKPWSTLNEQFLKADSVRALAIWSGVDLAISDAWSRTFSVPLQTALQDYSPVLEKNRPETKNPIENATTRVTAPIGLAPLPLQLGIVAGFRAAGFKDFKIKIHTSKDVQNLSQIRRVLGHKCNIRVDINGSWTFEQAKTHLEEFERNGISAIEQPLAQTQHDDSARLQNLTAIPIMADESYCSLLDAADLGSASACKMLNFRLGKNGGFSGWFHHKNAMDKYSFDIQLGTLVGELGPIPAASSILRPISQCRFFEFGFPRVLIKGSPFSQNRGIESWDLNKLPLNSVVRTLNLQLGLAQPPNMGRLKQFLIATETLVL